MSKLIVYSRDEKRIADLNWEKVANPLETMDTKGESLFSFDYPLEEEDSAEIEKGRYVIIPDYERPQDFQMYEITKVSHDETMLFVDCEHHYIGELSGGEKVTWNTNADTPDIAMAHTLQNERYEVGIVEVTRRLGRSVKGMPPLSALRYIEKEWGGELRFRVVFVGAKVSKLYVDLLERRGARNGVRFEIGHNLEKFKHIVDSRNVVTAMYGVASSEGEDGEEFTFADIVWDTSKGDPVDKPLGQTWVGDEDYRVMYGRPDGYGGRKHIFGEWKSEAETKLGLLQETWLKVRQNRDPLVNIEADVVALSEINPEFQHERTQLGDDVFLIFRHDNRVVELEARIIKAFRDRKQPSNTKYQLGNYLPAYSKRIDKIQEEVDINSARRAIHDRAEVINPDRTIDTDILKGVIDTIRNEVVSSLGHVYQTPQGIMILDDDREGNPTMALLLSGGKFSIANSKDASGDWEWRLYGDGDGFVADEIITGTLRTNLVEIFGNAFFKWNGNNIYIIDPDNSQKQIRIGQYDGENYGIAFTEDGGADWNIALDFNGFKIGVKTQFEEGYDPSTKASYDDVLQAESQAKAYAEQKAQEAETASKAHADAVAEAERIEAEAYADGIVTAEEEARIADAQAKLEEARQYAEEKASEAQTASNSYAQTLTNQAKTYAEEKAQEAEQASKTYADTKAEAERVLAEAYADGVVTAEEQARINDVNAKLAQAKTYADEKKAEAIQASNAYTAQEVALAKQYADTKKQEAIDASNAHAEAVAEQERIIAEAYADGLIDEEERARIEEATAKLNEAKLYADQKKAEAIQASENYANQVEQRAKDYAKPAVTEVYDDDFSHGRDFWSDAYEGKDIGSLYYGTVKPSDDGEEGGNVLELQGQRYLFSKNAVPVNVNRVYEVSFRVRQTTDPTTAGTSRVYAGVATLDKNFNNLTGGAGFHRYCAVAGTTITASDGWQTFTGIISTVGDLHSNFRAGTKYVRPMAIVNYASGSGTVEVDSLNFKDVTEMLEVKGRLNEVEFEVGESSIVMGVVQQTLMGKADSADLEGYVTTDDLTNANSDLINQMSELFGGVDDEFDLVYQAISQVELTAQALDIKFSSSGGVNLLRNSVGFSGTDFWIVTGTVQTRQDLELETRGAGSGFFMPTDTVGKLVQTVNVQPNLTYTISAIVKKGASGSARLTVTHSNGQVQEVIWSANQIADYEQKQVIITPTGNNVTVELYSTTASEAVFTSVMFNVGNVALQWQHSAGEIYNTNVKMDLNGIKVISATFQGYTAITPQEFSGYAEVAGQMKRVFTLNRDVTEVSKLKVEGEIKMTPIKILPVTSGGYKGWAFVPE